MAEARQFNSFFGGINQQLSDWVQENDQYESFYFCSEAENVDLTVQGIGKAPGYEAFGVTLGAAVRSVFSFKGKLIAMAGGKIWEVGASSNTELATGFSTSATWQATEYQGVLVLCNGVDPPQQYNGTAVTAITITDNTPAIWSNARPQGAAVFRRRLFYWGDPTNPDRVYTPRPGTLGNFDTSEGTADAFDVDLGFGGVVTGIRSFTNDFLAICKQRCTRRLTGDSPFGSTAGESFAITPVSDEVGCLASRTIIPVGKDHLFFSDRGLRRFTTSDQYGDVDVQQPGQTVKDINSGLAWQNISTACAVYIPERDEVLVSVPNGSSSSNNLILTYSPTYETPTRRTGIQANCFVMHNRVLHFGSDNGRIYRYSSGFSYAGAAYPAKWVSKWVSFGGIARNKRFRRLTLIAEGTGQVTFFIKWQILQGDRIISSSEAETAGTGVLWDSATWDVSEWDTAGPALYTIPNLGRGQAIKLEINIPNANESVRIRQMMLEFDLLGSMRG